MPRALVIRSHVATYTDPIRFRAGDRVTVHREDSEFPGWYWCSAGDGKEGWVHAHFLSRSSEGAIAAKDYSALELSVCVGESVEVGERVGGWVCVVAESGTRGWVPEASLMTMLIPAAVRPRSRGDDPEWARLRQALWPDSTIEIHRVEMKAWLNREDAIVLVAPRADGGLCGFAEIGARSIADGCDSSPVAYLEGWYVDPDFRGRGVGAALVRAAEDWGRARGYLELASDAELDNVDGQRAHAGVGFIEVGRAVLYLKSLSRGKPG